MPCVEHDSFQEVKIYSLLAVKYGFCFAQSAVQVFVQNFCCWDESWTQVNLVCKNGQIWER